MNIKLTKAQRDFVAAKLKSGHYASPSEVIREALRTQAAIEARQEMLEQAVEQGIQSGPAQVADAKWWSTLDSELEKKHGRRPRRAA